MLTPNCMLHLIKYDVQFIDEFYSNLSYKNKYNPCFQPLCDMSVWPIYINPNIYRCPIRWWENKD